MAPGKMQNYASQIPNTFIIIGSQLKKWFAEVITWADVFRKIGDTAAVIFAPSKHLPYDLHSSSTPGCKQAAVTHVSETCDQTVQG
jgi:hypothetical protein